MARVKKEALDTIIKLLLKDVSTEEIAKITNYSIGTIRSVIADLREEYGVNSKTGVATAYFNEELLKIKILIDKLTDLTNLTPQIGISAKTCTHLLKPRKKK